MYVVISDAQAALTSKSRKYDILKKKAHDKMLRDTLSSDVDAASTSVNVVNNKRKSDSLLDVSDIIMESPHARTDGHNDLNMV